MTTKNWMRIGTVMFLWEQTKTEGKPNSRTRLWLFNANYIWSRLLLLSQIALARTEQDLHFHNLSSQHFPANLVSNDRRVQ